MSDFWLLVELGFSHVWDWQGVDHLLFLTALCLPFSAKQWKPLLWLITCFTIGHSLSLILASLEVVEVSSALIEFLIPVSIAATAVYNMVYAQRVWVRSNRLVMWITLFFGLVHGFGFAGYFELIRDVEQSLWISLLSFAFGIEAAQIVLGALMLLLSFVVLNVLRRNRRDWVLVVSSVIIGILLPIIIERWP
ncbi:MAG: HupE/UreJ family protein [Flavobacteriaceae bacterium]|nr:HupE/UreJ family protein [Flavobacteriaceae bacterium]